MTKLRSITAAKRLQALSVDIIRRLWDRGMYRDNKWLRMIHDNWMCHWIDVKTAVTMDGVDKQIEQMSHEPEIIPPLYWEESEGETPLGGPLGYRYEFTDD
tara:strand:+ start:144 stop:446 length:303 start_codon:yes stop_codon:yes gene_type:complete